MKSYLNNREQFVDVEGITSSKLKIKTGVPQGSILGPLLFILYINDINQASNKFHFVSYADDTTLSINLSSMSDVNTTSNNLNNELINVSEWLKLNKLSLNINKTKCMLFHHANKVISRPVLKIDDTELEYVDNFCFLGIILDVNLSWKGHVDSISKKLAKIIGIMTKLKHFLPQPTLKIMYDSLIGSHLNYGIKCWGFNCKSLEKLQKKGCSSYCK
jgi:hypothetical protein